MRVRQVTVRQGRPCKNWRFVMHCLKTIIATETKVMLLRQRAAKFKSTLHRYKKIIWTHSKTSNIAKQIINRCLKCLSICCSSKRTHKKPYKNIFKKLTMTVIYFTFNSNCTSVTMTELMDIGQYIVIHCSPAMLQIHHSDRHLQATALVCYEVRKVRQCKAVPEVKQRHDVSLQNSAPWRERDIKV